MTLAERITYHINFDNPILQLVIAFTLGLVLGFASLQVSPILILVGIVGLAASLIVLKRPVILLLGVLVLSSTIIAENQVPTVPAGPMRLYLSDIFLLILVGIIIVRWICEPDFDMVHTPLNTPLLVFIVVCLLSTMSNLFFSSLDIGNAVTEMRIILYYGTFFIVINTIQFNKNFLRLLTTGVLLLSTLVAIAMILQFILGNSVRILPGRIETLITEGIVRSDITRIVTPGEALILTGFITVITIIMVAKTDIRVTVLVAACALLGLGVMLSFNRNFWVAVCLSVFLMFLLLRHQDRHRFWIWFCLFVLAGIVAFLIIFALPNSKTRTLVQSSVERVTSLLDPRTYNSQSETSTLRWRDFEYSYAMPQIVKNPILGMGLGARYRPYIPGIDHANFDGRHFVHNAHVWILIKTGLLGYTVFAWLSTVFLARCLTHWRGIKSPGLRGIILGFALTYIGVIVGSIVNPMLMQWYWTPVIGIMMGVCEAIIRINSLDHQGLQEVRAI